MRVQDLPPSPTETSRDPNPVGASAICPSHPLTPANSFFRLETQTCSSCRLTTTRADYFPLSTMEDSSPPCCSLPVLKRAEKRSYRKYIRCWACEDDLGFEYAAGWYIQEKCLECKFPYDGSEMVVWKEWPQDEGRYVDIEEVMWGIMEVNKEIRIGGKVCEHCGKWFKARGLRNHQNKCGPGKNT